MCNQIDLEYEKLSELIHGLTVCADDEADARTDCPFYDENEPNKCTINQSLDECHMFIDDNFIKEKNEQLQKLVQEMYKVIKERNSWWDCMSRDTKRFADRMRELGIEVD